MNDFNFTVHTAPSRSQLELKAKADSLMTLLFWGAIACLLLTPIWFDWGARFTARNTILSVMWVLVYAMLPMLILWRIKSPEKLPYKTTLVAGIALGVLFVGNSITWLTTGVGTTGEWLEIVMRFVLAGILIGYDRHWFPVPFTMGVFVLFCLVMLSGAIVRFWDVSTLTTADWKAYTFLNVRTTLAGFEKLLIAALSIGFALKAISSQHHSPSAAPQPETPEAAAAQSHSPSRFKAFLSSLSARTTAATQIIARQTEHTKLTTLTLPAAYRALGKDCVQQGRHLHCVPKLLEQLRSVMGDLKKLTESAKAQPAAHSITDKAKAAGKQAADLARQKHLGMKRDALLGEIGKAIHDLHGEASGPIELITPIQNAMNRIAELDADIAHLSAVEKGSLLTPTRLVIVGSTAAVLLVGVMFVMAGSWMFGGKNSDTNGSENNRSVQSSENSTLSGGKGFAQRVLDTDPNLFTGSNVRSHKNVVKDFTPKHPAGTKADAIQAITMLTPGHPPNFIRHSEGVSSFIGLRCDPALWNAVFGRPENVRTNMHNKHEWFIRCSDGELRCVGDILGNQYFGVDVVFIE